MGCILPPIHVQKTIHSDEHAHLRDLLVTKREASKMTQSALAERLSMPQSFVSKVERGERLLDVVEFARYIAALNADPVRVFSQLVRKMKSFPKPTKKPTSR